MVGQFLAKESFCQWQAFLMLWDNVGSSPRSCLFGSGTKLYQLVLAEKINQTYARYRSRADFRLTRQKANHPGFASLTWRDPMPALVLFARGAKRVNRPRRHIWVPSTDATLTEGKGEIHPSAFSKPWGKDPKLRLCWIGLGLIAV